MKISILLPYKENFSPNYPGAVSIFLKDTIKNSRYKKNILVFGNTKYRKKLLKSYKNLVFKRSFLKSSSKLYLNKFIDYEKKNNSDLIIVTQIAGLIARRIVCDVKEGDTINQGDRFGMIRFGSKVDIYFQNYNLLACKGQNTVAGETLLAIKK